MSSQTIRNAIVNALNELRDLLFEAEGDNQKRIRGQIQQLLKLLDRVIAAKLSEQTTSFSSALNSLDDLTKEAKTAKQDIDKIASTIQKGADAISKLEKLVSQVVGFL